MVFPTRTGLLLILALQQCARASEENESCAAGRGKCSAGMSEEGSQSLWSRFTSILSHKKSDIGSYTSRFNDDGTLEERTTTDEYYDLATDFYEYGWGSSFHFAARYEGESLTESIKRHEHYLSGKLGLKAGQQVADLGMGVGGPLRQIAKFSGASITGVSINNYQVRRAQMITKQRESAAAAKLMNYVHGDFTNLVPKVFAPESLDAAYYIESACHLSNRTEVFAESARALNRRSLVFLASSCKCFTVWRTRLRENGFDSSSSRKFPCDLKDEDMMSRASSLLRMAIAFSMLATSSERRRFRSFHSVIFTA